MREAIIVGSVLARVSVPIVHSAAALLKLCEMPYAGTTSMFIKVRVHKQLPNQQHSKGWQEDQEVKTEEHIVVTLYFCCCSTVCILLTPLLSPYLQVLLNKKYALPYRVIDNLVLHFTSFGSDTRRLPVIWHQVCYSTHVIYLPKVSLLDRFLVYGRLNTSVFLSCIF